MRILSVSCLRDEGPFLLEWLAWHRMIGVTDFLMYSNDCSDGSDLMLDALDQAGILHHIRNQSPPDKSVQWHALKHAWRHPLRKECDWMLVSDLDEFPMIHVGEHHFNDLIAALPQNAQAITLPWRLFGHSGILSFHDQPVTGQFVFAAPPDMLQPIASSMFKTLFRPKAFKQPGIHRPAQQKTDPEQPLGWYDGSGQELGVDFARNDQRLSLIQQQNYRNLVELNHYSTRSAQSYLCKSQRGLPNRRNKNIDLSYWVERNYNSVANHAALALQDPLRAEIAHLKTLPKVAALHAKACAHHQQMIEQCLRDPESFKLYKDCLHCASATVLPERIQRHLLQLFQRLTPNSD